MTTLKNLQAIVYGSTHDRQCMMA